MRVVRAGPISIRRYGNLPVNAAYPLGEEHIYADQAASGARKDRAGLATLLAASESGAFEVVLVDDLSRLARDNYLMLSILAELRFNGVRVVSVADGLDSDDEEANLGIQIRGIFNELQLRDLKKKTLRGQIGQKERGFAVGERTFGYKSVPVGILRMDKKGRPRPDGYKMTIEPREAGIVLRIFQEFADGNPLTRIVKRLNAEGVAERFLTSRRWSPATITRILRCEKYTGHWIWNRTETRRDPRTGRRRRFPKPESQWIVQKDESLRIVPQSLWERVQSRLRDTRATWPGRKGVRGFNPQQSSRLKLYPTHLLSGAMTWGACGNAIAQVSGKSGGYYGCLSAAKSACQNKLLVRRTLTERVIVAAVRDRLLCVENISYVMERVAQEVGRGEGRGSRALAQALEAAELNVERLRAELDALEHARRSVFQVPPLPWIEERVAMVQEVLERSTERSALLLRKVLGPITLEPTQGDIGRPYYRARSDLDVLALLEDHPQLDGLWEIRTDLPTQRTARVLVCLYRDHLVALHGFVKKTRATPGEDLALARKRHRELTR